MSTQTGKHSSCQPLSCNSEQEIRRLSDGYNISHLVKRSAEESTNEIQRKSKSEFNAKKSSFKRCTLFNLVHLVWTNGFSSYMLATVQGCSCSGAVYRSCMLNRCFIYHMPSLQFNHTHTPGPAARVCVVSVTCVRGQEVRWGRRGGQSRRPQRN